VVPHRRAKWRRSISGLSPHSAAICSMLWRLPTAAVSTYAYVNPVIAVSLGALLLGERLTIATVLGGAVILASVALLLLHRSRE
jgi:drug/metabolite transporter (DMT)-like permease